LTLASSNRVGERALDENHITLNANQRQRLLITCKHVDKLLEDIEETMNATASKSVFPSYAADITPSSGRPLRNTLRESADNFCRS